MDRPSRRLMVFLERSLLASLLVLLCAVPARAQFDSAQVSGVVQDATGAALPGVDVTLRNDATGRSAER